MEREPITLTFLPKVNHPTFIAGFEGWGNALDVSSGMIDYLIRKLHAAPFGEINPDLFYRFDENRPTVDIKKGLLQALSPPGGSLYTTHREDGGRDVVLFKGIEPDLRWSYFVTSLLSLCRRMDVKTIISLGSMYDNVLHTDKVISVSASDPELLAPLKERGLITSDYQGPSAIHSSIHVEAKKQGIDSLNFWCHCPYYLQGTTHFGLLSELGVLLASLGKFDLDTEELKVTWKNLMQQIQGLIDSNPELQAMIEELRKAKIRKPWGEGKKQDKVIHLADFLKP